MAKCLSCENEFERVEGKRDRLYCSDKCRVKFNQSQKRKTVTISKEEYERLTAIKPSKEVKVQNLTQVPPTTNYSIDTRPKEDTMWDKAAEQSIQEQIDNLEEKLKMPPKFLPREQRERVEKLLKESKNELYRLKNKTT